MIYEVNIGIKLLACGLGTVRTGLEGFRPVKVKKEIPTSQQSKVHSGLVCVLSVECQ